MTNPIDPKPKTPEWLRWTPYEGSKYARLETRDTLHSLNYKPGSDLIKIDGVFTLSQLRELADYAEALSEWTKVER